MTRWLAAARQAQSAGTRPTQPTKTMPRLRGRARRHNRSAGFVSYVGFVRGLEGRGSAPDTPARRPGATRRAFTFEARIGAARGPAPCRECRDCRKAPRVEIGHRPARRFSAWPIRRGALPELDGPSDDAGRMARPVGLAASRAERPALVRLLSGMG